MEISTSNNMTKYSLHEPLLKKKEKINVKQCLESGWLSPSGNFVHKFEKKLENFTKTNVVCCNSGTSALHISLILAGVKPGNEVIVPTITFIATVNAVLYCSANPIFMDCDQTLNTDIDKILNFLRLNTYFSKKITYNKKTKKKISAIVFTSVFGNLANLKNLHKECKKKNIKLIEDSAESLGSICLENNKHSGINCDYGTLSFNVNKIITTGAGGAILFRNQKEKKKIKKLISQGKSDNLLFKHDLLGYNYGMPNINAAIGCAQLENINNILIKKKNINLYYKKFFSKIKNIRLIQTLNEQNQNYWLNAIKFQKIDYSSFKKNINLLISLGIDVRPLWYPCHKQAHLKKYEVYDIKYANNVYKNILCLPSSYFLKNNDLSNICNIILNVFEKK